MHDPDRSIEERALPEDVVAAWRANGSPGWMFSMLEMYPNGAAVQGAVDMPRTALSRWMNKRAHLREPAAA